MSKVDDAPPAPTPTDASGVGLRIYTPTLRGYKIKMLIYGEPGVGKTTLAATAGNVPDMCDVLFINIESGIMSVIDAGEVGLKTTPKVIDFNSFEDLDSIFWFLQKEKHPYKTVVIDSLSELANYNLDKVVSGELGKRTSKGQVRTDVDEVFLDDYGKSTKQMRRVIRQFRDLDMHVIFTCSLATSKEGDKIFPALSAKLRDSTIGFMDVVSFMYTVEEKEGEGDNAESRLRRKILTQPWGKYIAKDRSPGGKLGMIVTDPSMPLLWERITGGTTNGK